MSNYSVWTVEMLEHRRIEFRRRLLWAKSRNQLLSVWGEVEAIEAALKEAILEDRRDEKPAEGACLACGLVWQPDMENAQEWGVYHGSYRDVWLCPEHIDDRPVRSKLGDVPDERTA